MAEFDSMIDSLAADFAPGSVVLAGAGFGGMGSLTLEVLACLRRCDVLVFDALVDESILALANREAKCIPMGKRAGGDSSHQDDINLCLLEQARRGLRVLRLKGGDPGVFGRGAEEAAFLLKRGIDCRWLPGVSAALGCGAAAMIPLTHRGLARSVSFVTGQQMGGQQIGGEGSRHWQQLLAQGNTLVFYMGANQAGLISASLQLAGASATLPCALVRDGGRPSQQLKFCPLKDLSTAASTLKGDGPCLMLVGEVCAVGEELNQLRAELLNGVDACAAEVVYG